MLARPLLPVVALLVACPRAEAPDPPTGAVEARPVQLGAEPAPEDARLPARFEADRVFLELRTADGQPLRLYTDTGGGLFVHERVVTRLRLPIEQVPGDDGQPLEVVRLPALDPATPMPDVLAFDGRLPIARENRFSDAFADGMLGQAWFRDRVWTFDYPAHTLTLHPGSVGCDDGSMVPLGFPVENGRRITSYPRIQAEIDGRVLDLLFDTGATVMLTEPALAALGDGGASERATSFIVRSVLDGWRRDHPDWRVIEDADRMGGDPMIEVPSVRIGELRVGPVWFTARADPNFHEWMSQWMDRRIEGALGGSALRYLRVTVDYPAAQACVRTAE